MRRIFLDGLDGDETAFFSLPNSPGNIEVILKVLAVPKAWEPDYDWDPYWVYAAGATDLRLRIIVHDTELGHEVWYEEGRRGQTRSLGDTVAFASHALWHIGDRRWPQFPNECGPNTGKRR